MGFRGLLENGLGATLRAKIVNCYFPSCQIGSARVSRGADLGDRVVIAHDVEVRSNVRIGRWTYIEPYAFVNSAVIGNFCAIGRNVVIGAFQHPYTYPAMSPKIYRDMLQVTYDDSPHIVEVGNDVWIGERAILLKGRIGDGAIIGAGAVVTKDVPPYSVVVGTPAHVIGYRFSEEEISFLLDLAWWTWSDDEIKANKPFFEARDQWAQFVLDDIEAFKELIQ